MGTNWEELLGKLRADPAYREAFAHAYGDDLQPSQVLDALASFQRSLLTRHARFDRWLRGEADASVNCAPAAPNFGRNRRRFQP